MPTDYDPQRANSLLDEMDLNKRDADGWCLRPDGKRFVIPFEVAKLGPWLVATVELIVKHLKKVEIYTSTKIIDPGLWGTRAAANEIKVTTAWDHAQSWWGWGGRFDNGNIHRFAWPLWWSWHTTGGESGEEPPAKVKRFFELLDLSVVGSPQEAKKIIDEYRHLLHEEVWFHELIWWALHTTIVAKNMANFPHGGMNNAANYMTEVCFSRSSRNH